MDRLFTSVSLRRGFALTFGALASLAAIAAAVLLAITLLLHANAHASTAATVRDQTARDVEIDLLMHSQISYLALARDGAQAAELSALAARQKEAIGGHLADVRHFPGTPGEQVVLADLERSVARYFAVHEQVRSQGVPLNEAVERTQAALDVALHDAKALGAIARADMEHATSDAQLMLHVAIAVAVVVAVAVVLVIAASLVAVRSAFHRPLLALHDAIERFAAGQTSARAEESVPLELGEVARTFNRMAARIARQRSDELSSLAGIAHDLKNPVHVLGLLTAPTAIDRAVQSEEHVRRTLGLVNRQVQRLHRMVSDLLDTARIEAGQLRLQLGDCDLREIARAAVDLHQGVSEAHEVRLSVPDDAVVVRCDAERLEQALHNLIGNAIKYSPGGGRVVVSLAASGPRAILAVSDDGIGMTEEQQAGLFEPFRRAGPPGIPGAGLGLSLVKKIVEAHGGEIELESAPGIGSTFRISLPREQPPDRRASAPPGEHAHRAAADR